jgi:hypothetical protein
MLHRVLIVCFAIATLAGCKNPFAPALDDTVGGPSSALGDQHTTEGFFQKFAFAYTTRDSAIYGQLLGDNFTFIFRDYDNNVDQTWGRDVEMRTTEGLFQNAQNISLTWNNILLQSGDSLAQEITRSFNLTVTFNPQDVVYITGRADFSMIRPHSDSVWMLSRWRDNSSF